MEYTKDVIFNVQYDKNEIRKHGWTSRMLNVIRGHKVITATVFSAFAFIAIDIVLLSNFFKILTII